MLKAYFVLFGVGVSCRILYSIVSYLYVSCSGSIASVGKKALNLLLSFTFNYEVSVRMGSSSSWCLGWAMLFYSGEESANCIATVYF